MISARTQLLLMATVIVWIVAYAAYTADWAIGVMPFVTERALRRIPVCLFGALCCWAMKTILDRTAGARIRTRIAAAIGLSLAASLAYAAVNTLTFYVIDPLWGRVSVVDALQASVDVAFVFFAWSALYFAVDADGRARDARLRLADAEAAMLRARNQALAQQISPHFLFNALNAVSGLILDGHPARAERVTLALSSLLRRSLDSDPRRQVPLHEELDAVRRYLEIEQSRFEHRLEVVEEPHDAHPDWPVPPMIVQPLVENAVKHGVARSSAPVRLTISTELDNGKLRIRIADDARPDLPSQEPRTGMGQAIVRQRLSLAYGDAASLHCSAQPDGGYLSELHIPLASADDA